MKKKTSVIALILMLVALASTTVPVGATPGSFEGVTNYYTYAVKSQELLQDLNCPATAELTFLDGQQVELLLTENGACGGRTIPLEGTMTPRGQIKLWYPDWLGIEDIVMAHTGCTFIAGAFPVYHGSFDGQSFVAYTTFTCMIPEYWPPNDLFPTPVDGPMHWQWTIDLTSSP